MTHVMRIGTYHMELVPDKDIDVEKIFNEMLNNLIQNFGEKLLEINVLQVKEDGNGNPYHPAFSPSALSFSYIWYAPDHVRAWNKKFYNLFIFIRRK